MFKKLTFFIVLLLIPAYESLPLTNFWYNCIAVNSTGQLLPSTTMNVRITVQNGSGGYYQETQTGVFSDQFGVILIKVGVGGSVTGSLAGITVTADTRISAETNTGFGWVLSEMTPLSQVINNNVLNNGSGVVWKLEGNAGTVPGTNFLGTTDDVDLVFKINGTESGRLTRIKNNTSFGNRSLSNITSGTDNTAVGSNSLSNATTGSQNTSIGTSALYSNSGGFDNTAAGYQALYSNQTGFYNVANGALALHYNTTGNNNVATGYSSLILNTTGNNNAGYGTQSLYSNTSGNFNIGIGTNVLYSNTTGGGNTAAGYQSMSFSTTGNNNTAYGFQTLSSNTTAGDNTALGNRALWENVTGAANTAVGSGSLLNNTTGPGNVSTGFHSMFSNTSGQYNTANGYQALWNNTAAEHNVSVGAWNMYYNTTGEHNTAVGSFSLYNNLTASQNTSVGYYALNSNTSGANNTAIGTFSLKTNATGSNNTAIGYNTEIENGLNNVTLIGANTGAIFSNMVRLGDVNVTKFYCNAAYNTTTPLFEPNMYVAWDGQIVRSTATTTVRQIQDASAAASPITPTNTIVNIGTLASAKVFAAGTTGQIVYVVGNASAFSFEGRTFNQGATFIYTGASWACTGMY